MTEQNQQPPIDQIADQAINEAQFMIQRLYIKGSSYETKNTPAIFQQEWQPELDLNLNTTNNLLEPNVYEVVLSVTVTVKSQKMTAFLVEVEQAGIFTVQGVPSDQLDHLLNSFCPNILYPYAREAITSQVLHGSFPQLVLAPINFDAMYMQKLKEKQPPVDA